MHVPLVIPLSPPAESIFGSVNTEKKRFVGKCEEKRKIKLPHVRLSIHHLVWKKIRPG